MSATKKQIPTKSLNSPLRVVELFAGVGGFRIGLERSGGFEVVWSNQWEPGRKQQHASDVYVSRFGGEHHVCSDIASVKAELLPDHDLMVGGFPCQDYSVASTLKNSKGLVGKKGILWWQIHRLLSQKKNKPQYLLLENVDRLLGSPVGQRGRDFAVMLSSLSALGYAVQWRVINAADHGMPQRRKRVFLFGELKGDLPKRFDAVEAITTNSLFARAFGESDPVGPVAHFLLDGDLAKLTRAFNHGGKRSPFQNAGMMQGGQIWTLKLKVTPDLNGSVLADVLLPTAEVPKVYFIPKRTIGKWRKLKAAKKQERIALNGHRYNYAEGAMAFPDALDKPSRTIVTGEGGTAPSRFKHVILTEDGRYRRLTPVELERLNMFPDNHTAGVSDGWRAFFMGNALVTGVVARLAAALIGHHQARSKRPK